MASPRVLVVDDDEAVRWTLVMMLEQLGLAVDSAANGLERIEALRGRAYSLVLMDINMPVCDGIAATRAIRTTFAPDQQPIIVGMTGRGDGRDARGGTRRRDGRVPRQARRDRDAALGVATVVRRVSRRAPRTAGSPSPSL
jgi:CheY-like chemotaxis protein